MNARPGRVPGPAARPYQNERVVIARLVRRLADRTGRAASRVTRNPGPDNVHELRVATRRLRAVLKMLRGELQPRLYAELNFDLKNLTRETGRLRDADVRRQFLMPMIREASQFPPDVQRDCAIVLEQARTDAREELRSRMREAQWPDRLARVRATARDPDLVAAQLEPLGEFVSSALGRQLADLRRRMRRGQLGPRRLHRLRMRIRDARYAAEATLPLLRQRSAPLAGTLQRLQDRLGEAHDLTEAQSLLAGSFLSGAVGVSLAETLDASAERQLRRCRRKLRSIAKDPPPEWRSWIARARTKRSSN
jgi:CHAD domain-containing protein